MEGLIHNWLSDPRIVNYVLASVFIWRYMGFHIVLFMAGLSSVPKDMMEAAVVDGANAWQRLRYIQLPAIRTVIDFMLFDVINGSLQMFDIPYITHFPSTPLTRPLNTITSEWHPPWLSS